LRAASEGHTEILQLLLGRGASVLERDKHLRTALHRAALNKRVATAKELLGQGASLSVLDEDKSTPLHFVVKSRSSEMVAFLLDR
jgi:ankyrin repeat protein